MTNNFLSSGDKKKPLLTEVSPITVVSEVRDIRHPAISPGMLAAGIEIASAKTTSLGLRPTSLRSLLNSQQLEDLNATRLGSKPVLPVLKETLFDLTYGAA